VATTSLVEQLADEVSSGSRRAVSQALSLIESTKPQDVDSADALLDILLLRQAPTNTRRIGITGAPGVGKSTMLERFGLELINSGHRVAILPVDPSSKKTGGSILGDKVRMPQLSLHNEAFIRPSPSKATMGGTTATTSDAIVVCEAAGFDTVIVETVGVGQSETEAADMVDLFMLLVMPQSGDDMQGMKRGIMEVADAIVITKSDLSLEAARRTQAMYTSAVRLMQPSKPQWETPVVHASATVDDGLHDVMSLVEKFFVSERAAAINNVRKEQRIAWFDDLVRRAVVSAVRNNPTVDQFIAEQIDLVASGRVTPSTAVQRCMRSVSITVKEQL